MARPVTYTLAIGQRFEKLQIIRSTKDKNGRTAWVCRCDCGSETVASSKNLRSGRQATCGCGRKEACQRSFVTHGATRNGAHSREYRSWTNAKSRCFNPKNNRYALYGGRGITMCDHWRNDFAAFLADVGPAPSGNVSIDRIDSNGNYEPGNVRWATAQQQANNHRNSAPVAIDGELLPLGEIARRHGVAYYPLWFAVRRRGMDPVAAVESLKSHH